MEDTYLTIGDYLKFFREDKRIEKNLRKRKNGIINTYGCVCKTINEFKFVNTLEYYSAVINIHLVKITDIHDDPRTLIEEFTNNSTNKEIKDLNKETEDRTNLRKVDNSRREILKRVLFRGAEYGKLPEDEQYSDPITRDNRNKFAISFTTALKTKLNDSVIFSDRAVIVKTWRKILTPGSQLHFKLEHHMGKGIHLNYLFDLENSNPDHPSGYIYVLEYFGDRRGKLKRKKDDDCFLGYTPVRLHCEFKHKIKYIAQDLDNDQDEVPCVYREKKNDLNFEDQSIYDQIFTPNREPEMHIPYKNIKFLTDSNTSAKDKEYILEYDQSIAPEINVLDTIKKIRK